MEKTHLINNQIKSNKILLLQEGQKPLELNFHEALQKARTQELDLMQVGDNSGVAICKILKYDSWLYHEKKKKDKQDFKNRSSEVKGMWFRPSTGQHDFDMKIRKINEFLNDGHKVKISIKLERRESTLKLINDAVVEKIIESLRETGSVDGKISTNPKEISFMVKSEKKSIKTPKP